MLKPQDIVILLKLVSQGSERWSYNQLAYELVMSPAEVHAGIKRAIQSSLFDPSQRRPIKQALFEFLKHGIKYSFPPDRGGPTRGMPTGSAAAPLSAEFVDAGENPVWPDPEGDQRGYEFSPLYKSVPEAARKDAELYELLTLVDAIRGGRTRERNMAIDELQRRLELTENE